MNRQEIGPVQAVTPAGIIPGARIEIEEGKIVSITADCTASTRDLPYALPAFIDPHIHGAGGFGPEQNNPESLLKMSTVLARQGVAAFCPTLYCAKPEQMGAVLRTLLPALGQETGAKIIGFHLEGPFISPRKPGVMNPQDIAPADLDDFKKIYEAAQGHIAIVTLAPEIPGIDPIIDFCLRQHIVPQAGHTNATYEQMQAAFDKGVRRVTHWGNAMSGPHQRKPGVFTAALDNPGISCEVIADGKHVHPAWLSVLRHLKPISQISVVTDALLPTGQAQGPFYANSEEVVLQEGVWKRKQDGVTAGSCLTMLEALRQLVQAGYTLPEAAACTSTHTAQLFGVPAALQPQSAANLVLISPDLQKIEAVFLHGQSI